MTENTKINIMIFSMLSGCIYWGISGFKFITETDGFKSIVSPLIENGLFSLQGMILSIVYASVVFYPMILWVLICIEVQERGSALKFIKSESRYFWLVPFTFIIISGILLFLFVARTLLALVIFVGVPAYLLIGYVREMLQKDAE